MSILWMCIFLQYCVYMCMHAQQSAMYSADIRCRCFWARAEAAEHASARYICVYIRNIECIVYIYLVHKYIYIPTGKKKKPIRNIYIQLYFFFLGIIFRFESINLIFVLQFMHFEIDGQIVSSYRLCKTSILHRY